MAARRLGWEVGCIGACGLLALVGCTRDPLGPSGEDQPPTSDGAAGQGGSGHAGGGAGGQAGRRAVDAASDAVVRDAGRSDARGGGGRAEIDGGAPAVDARPDAAPPTDAGFVISFPAGSSVAYQVDIAHTGNQPSSLLAPPLTKQWTVDLGGQVSYPLVVDGRVFVTIGDSGAYGTKVEALDLQTGAVVWGPIDIGGTYYWSNAAYDQGRIYVINFDGLMTALDAATGATDWVKEMPGQYAFSSPPTAAGGMVFVGGAGSGGTVYGVDGASGKVLWTAEVENGDDSSPAVSATGVYVSYACVQAYDFAPLDGKPIWHHSGECEGGGGDTPVLYDGRIWARDNATDNLVLDAATGDTIAGFSASTIPAFAGTRGFFLVGGNLQALDLDTRMVLWTFLGDGTLVSPPLVVNGVVYVGSSSGELYGVDPTTGAERWSDLLPWGISPSDEFDVSQPLAGMGAGGDSLLVPGGTHLACYR